ncbi:hypothetical protein V7182_18870 [Neobacillus drentensis]|uniref:hypothetical protein n=1 Tax=Neobacillus drentensis TaxID=220684 RepID=UPI002FFDA2E4
MNSLDLRELRAEPEQVKRKINNGLNVTSEELATLRRYAQANPTAATIGLYAIGKRQVKDEDTEE